MNTELDALERQLSKLCPARLPAPVRQNILHEMEGTAGGHRRTSWLLGHRAGFQVALAGALSLALVVSSHWLSRAPRPTSDGNQTMLATNNALLPSLAFLEAKFAATSQIGLNAVPVPRSASMLTNTQIRR
jgi:hypothetical protein